MWEMMFLSNNLQCFLKSVLITTDTERTVTEMCFCALSCSLLEECYAMKDPFRPEREKFLVLGSRCCVCSKTCVCGNGLQCVLHQALLCAGSPPSVSRTVVELEDQTREMREKWNQSGLAEQTNDGAADWMEEHVADRVERRVEWQTK
ncbi:hypothetical protein cypCar_00038453 [Cyprinus carpio]|nr:hypothetical protein cypCar_00038453 [Cyprinus carpio]